MRGWPRRCPCPKLWQPRGLAFAVGLSTVPDPGRVPQLCGGLAAHTTANARPPSSQSSSAHTFASAPGGRTYAIWRPSVGDEVISRNRLFLRGDQRRRL